MESYAIINGQAMTGPQLEAWALEQKRRRIYKFAPCNRLDGHGRLAFNRRRGRCRILYP